MLWCYIYLGKVAILVPRHLWLRANRQHLRAFAPRLTLVECFLLKVIEKLLKVHLLQVGERSLPMLSQIEAIGNNWRNFSICKHKYSIFTFAPLEENFCHSSDLPANIRNHLNCVQPLKSSENGKIMTRGVVFNGKLRSHYVSACIVRIRGQSK